MRTVRSPLLIACLILNACITDAPYKQERITFVPEQLEDGWSIGLAEDYGMASDILMNIQSSIYSEDQFFNTKSLLMATGGKLVFESYIQDDAHREEIGHIQSATKSMTSLVLGIVRQEGYLSNLDQPLYELIPDVFPNDAAKRSITIRHLLTMSSGLDIDNDIFSVEMYVKKPDNIARHILELPLYAEPGEQFYYRDCDPHLLSYTITRVTGRTEEQWAAEKIFGPLAITDHYWNSDIQGTSMGAHGLFLNPRDLAKIGQLMLNNGSWGDEQIIDSTWVSTISQQQVVTPSDYGWNYGYYWWRLSDWDGYTAWGHGGTFIMVIPSKEFVAVMTSMPDTNDEMVGSTLDKFEDLLRPLINSL